MSPWLEIIAWVGLGLQIPATGVLLSRLMKGRHRRPPLDPQLIPWGETGTVSIIVPTLNEAQRIGPCLAGLQQQTAEVREILVVDSQSQDGTPQLVQAAAQEDPRLRLITDDPLPPGWVGRPWALNTGFLHSSPKSQWILGIDADTQPQPGLVGSLLKVAETEGYDLVSVGPQFIVKSVGELLLLPALVVGLVYRVGPPGTSPRSRTQVMANGQCFLIRREVLAKLQGYAAAQGSFCDDVTLARYLADQGFKVGFLDGCRVLKVRMYEGALETWREQERTSALKDAVTGQQLWLDVGFLFCVQAMPLFVLGSLSVISLGVAVGVGTSFWWGLNFLLVAMRLALLTAMSPSYNRDQAKFPWVFWLSPLADPVAWCRVFLSAITQPRQWRGRVY